MDQYMNLYREKIVRRGLSNNTLSSYSTYVRCYLDYLESILKKKPEDATWEELRGYIRWIRCKRNLNDSTVNFVITQLRFFTIYVLNKPWDNSEIPRIR